MFTFPFTMMSSADGAYQPAGALWLDGAADYVTRTPSGAGNRRTFTISWWHKAVNVGEKILYFAQIVGTYDFAILRHTTDQLDIYFDGGSSGHLRTTQVFRDTTAWMHFCVSVDTTQASASNRVKLFVNGSQVTAFGTETYPSQNYDTGFSSTNQSWWGYSSKQSAYGEGYFADCIAVDGTASSDASEFGEDSNGIWAPKDPSTISSFGTNGFWLDFSNGSDIGNDVSGNNNDFTPTSMSTKNIAVDGPANSDTKEITLYASLDPDIDIQQNSSYPAVYSNNDLTVAGSGGHVTLKTNILTDGASKYVFEVTVTKHDTNIKIGAVLPSDAVSGGESLGTNSSTGQGWAFVADDSSNIYSSYRGLNTAVMVADQGGTLTDGDMFHIEFNNATGDVYVWRKPSGGTWSAQHSGATVVNDDGSNNGKTALAGAKVHLAGHLYQTSSTNLMTFNFSGPFDKAASSGYAAFTSTVTGIGNAATWNPLATSSNSVYSNGNRTFKGDSTVDDVGKGTIAVSSGKYYWRIYLNETTNDGYPQIGIQQINKVTTLSGGFAGSDDFTWIIFCEGSGGASPGGQGRHNSSETSQILSGIVEGDYIDHALDMDNGKLWWGRNGTWSGDPAAGSGEAYSGITGTVYPFANTRQSNDAIVTMDTSGGTVPTGFKRLNTASLPEPTLTPSEHFQTTTATESNIVSAVATARSGWSSYIDILKNRDSSENWIYRFSDDTSNELSSSNNTTYRSTSTLSGSDNWVGYSIRVDGDSKVRTGRVSHSNGANTTVTVTSVGTTNSIVFAVREGSSVGTWYFLHPDLDSGKMLTFSGSDAGDWSNTTINTVSATGFVIASGASSGTYRWIMFPESEVCSIGSYIGNGDTSGVAGPVVQLSFKPAFILVKNITRSQSWHIYDSTREPNNPVFKTLFPDADAGENSSNVYFDLGSNFFRPVYNYDPINRLNDKYVFLSFAETPFGLNNRAR